MAVREQPKVSVSNLGFKTEKKRHDCILLITTFAVTGVPKGEEKKKESVRGARFVLWQSRTGGEHGGAPPSSPLAAACLSKR